MMPPEESAAKGYIVSTRRLATAAVIGPILEQAQGIPSIHEVMPEPFDITNHAGNLGGGGAAIAAGAVLAYVDKNSASESIATISEESMSRFRRRGVVTVMGATALVNCVTETRWGVQYLPVARWLNGETPDVLDTVYSTVWGEILSLAFWKKAT